MAGSSEGETVIALGGLLLLFVVGVIQSDLYKIRRDRERRR